MPSRTSQSRSAVASMQMPVMADQDDRAFIFVEAVDQRLAAVDVQMVGRLVENEQVRRCEGGEREKQPRLLAAGQLAGGRVGLVGAKTRGGRAGALLRFGRVRHQGGDMIVSGVLRVQLVELVLGEIAEGQLLRCAAIRRQSARAARRAAWPAWICRCRWRRAGRSGRRCPGAD